MAQAGYGGSMKIATVAQSVEEWTLTPQRTEIDSTPLNSEDYTCLPGRTKHTGSATVQYDAASKARVQAYFQGASRTRAAVAVELWLDSAGTEKYTFNAILTSFAHVQGKDDLIRFNIQFTVSGAVTLS